MLLKQKKFDTISYEQTHFSKRKNIYQKYEERMLIVARVEYKKIYL